MTDTPKTNWPGQSGKTYEYWIYAIGTTFRKLAGNYIYAKKTSPNRWFPVYIGQTNDLAERLANHEREPCAIRHGATHLHVHLTGNETARLAEERDLIAIWNPPCNRK